MDDIGRYIFGSAGLLILLLIAMFYSAASTTIGSLHSSQLKNLAEEEGDKKAAKLYEIKQKQFAFSIFSGTVAIVMLSAALVLGTFLYAPALELLFPALSVRGSELITAAVLLFILLFFGYLLPKKLAFNYAEVFGNVMLAPLKLLNPLMYVMTGPAILLANLAVRASGHNPNAERDKVSEEEIRLLVDTGEEDGTIELSERDMINNVFDFDDRTVVEIMTHRTELCAVARDDSIEELIRLIREEGFSRIPVYGESVDDIIGVVYAKDLLVLAGCTDLSAYSVENYIHEVIYVPESTRCRMLFKQFKETKQHMAVVVDEYGGTAGIATMEDLLESIVGAIQDEYDTEEEEVVRRDDGTFSFDGSISIERIEDILDTDLEADEDTDTLSGLIITALGRIPEDDESPAVTIGDWLFTATKIEDRRIVRLNAQCVRKEETEDEE